MKKACFLSLFLTVLVFSMSVVLSTAIPQAQAVSNELLYVNLEDQFAAQAPAIDLNSSDQPRVLLHDNDINSMNYLICDVDCDDIDNWTKVDLGFGSAGTLEPTLKVFGTDSPRFVHNSSGLAYAFCDSSCDNSANWTNLTLDTGGVISYFDLELDASGNPRISYHHGGEDALKYAFCDASCGTIGNWTIITIDSVNDPGYGNALALDSSGNPRIVYADLGTQEVHLALCDASCGNPANWTLSDVTADGVSGLGDNDILIDASDDIHILYFTSLDLYYAKCLIASSCDEVSDWTGYSLSNVREGDTSADLLLDGSGNLQTFFLRDNSFLDPRNVAIHMTCDPAATSCDALGDWTENFIDYDVDSTPSALSFDVDSSASPSFVYAGNVDPDPRFASSFDTLDVLSTTPSQNALDVSQSAQIDVVFDESLDAGTVLDSTFRVYGDRSGLMSGTLSLTTTSISNDTIHFVPDANFLPGERISWSATNQISSLGGDNLKKEFVGQFTVETLGGNGQYYQRQDLLLGATEVSDVVTADLDLDGDMDLAVSDLGADEVLVSLNPGDGSFGAFTSYSVGPDPYQLEVGDVDADGYLDVVTVNNNGGGDGSISVIINDTGGGFGVNNQYPTAFFDNPLGLTLSDLDGDGYLDVALSQIHFSSGYLMLFENDGTGAFPIERRMRLNLTDANRIFAGDIDNDGDLDVSYTDNGSGRLGFVRNFGESLLSLFTEKITGNNTGIDGNDLNGDGFLDLVANDGGTEDSVLLNDGAGDFTLSTVSTVDSGRSDLTLADLDDDGDQDIISVNGGSNSFTTLVNDGSGNFASPTVHPTGANPFGVDSADLNGDGSPDIVTANRDANTLTIYYGDIAPAVEVILPNGGETLAVGQSYDIIWSASDDDAGVLVDLELTTDDATYNPIVGANGLANGMAYPFVTEWGAVYNPYAIDQDSSGNFYVTSSTGQVIKSDDEGNEILSWSGVGNSRGLVIDGNDRIYVSDRVTDQIRKYDTDGTLLLSWGTEGSGDGQLHRPSGLATDSQNNVYVADQLNHRISKFDDAGNFLGCLGGGVDGFQNPCSSFSGGFGDGFLYYPLNLVVSDDGAIYVVEGPNARMSKFTVDGTFVTNWSTGDDPSGVDVDRQGNVYVSSLSFEGFKKYTSNGSLLLTRMSEQLNGIYLDDLDNVYVSSTNDGTIIKYASGGSYTWTVPSTTTSQARIRAVATDSSAKTAQDDSDATFTIIPNAAPVATVPGSISQATDASGQLTFQTTLSDEDSNPTTLQVEYSDDGGTTFYDAQILSATPDSGTVDVNNASAYQIGSTDAIDTDGGAVTLTIVWDTQSSSNGNGAVVEENDIQLRVTPHDGFVDGSAQTTGNFTVDNQAPVGLTALADGTASSTTQELTWTAVTESNFDHYEIWYGEVQADVVNRTGTATEWDDSDDAALATHTTTSTTVTGLVASTDYFFKIFAVDSFGNTETVLEISLGTLSSSNRRRRDRVTPIEGSEAIAEEEEEEEEAPVEEPEEETTGGGVHEAAEDAVQPETRLIEAPDSLSAIQVIRRLQQLTQWLDPTSYELTSPARRLAGQVDVLLKMKGTLKTLADVVGLADGYAFQRPEEPELENVAELLKALMLSFSDCFSEGELERAISHDTSANLWWWAGYWHLTGQVLDQYLGEGYLLWSPLSGLQTLDVLESYLQDYCSES